MVFGEMVLVFGAGILAGLVMAYAKALRYWKTRVGTPSALHNKHMAAKAQICLECESLMLIPPFDCEYAYCKYCDAWRKLRHVS